MRSQFGHRLVVPSVAILFAVSLLAPLRSVAGDAPTTSEASVEPVPVDETRLYADAMGLNLEEASAQFKIMDLAGSAERDFATALGDTFGGLAIVHQPLFRVFVYGTSPASKDLVDAIARGWGLEGAVEFEVVRYPLSTLYEGVRTVSRALAGSANVGTDVIDNRLTIEVTSLDALTGFVPPINARIEVVPDLGRADDTIYGGAYISGCTAGFTIKKVANGTRGIVTAAHCGNSQSWGGNNLPFQAEDFGGSHDEQWHTVGTLGTLNRIWVDENGGWISITSRTFRANQAIGSWVCKFGATTHGACGQLDDKGYCPSWVPNCNGTFHKLTKDGLDLSSPGDSGGPVYASNSAWGIIEGEAFNIHTLCACNLIYTPVDFVESGLGIQVLTSP